jgi:hypothetical protein
MTTRALDDRLPVRDPERDMVEGEGLHGGTIPTGIRPARRAPNNDQRLRLVERELVERFFAAVFLPPRDAADLDGARLSPPADFRADVDFFFAAEVVFFLVADVFFFAADVVFLRALLADFERVALDERFAAVLFPPRDAACLDAAFFDAAFFDPAVLEDAVFEDARFALDFFFEAELDDFFFAADVFLLAAADVVFFADALFIFAAELFFLAPALDDFFRELAPVFVREDALAARVVLDPENAGSLGSGSGSCSRSPDCSPTVGARMSSRTSVCSSSSSLARSGERSSSESLWVFSSYRRSSLSLQSSDMSTPWGRLRGSFPHFGVCNASLPSHDARRARTDRYSSGGFCTSCSVAYVSVSWSTTAMPSPYA